MVIAAIDFFKKMISANKKVQLVVMMNRESLVSGQQATQIFFYKLIGINKKIFWKQIKIMIFLPDVS